MREITYDDITYKIPSTWDELDLEQQQIAVTKLLPLVNKVFMISKGGDKLEPVSNDVILQMHIVTLQLLLKQKNEFFDTPHDHIHFLINKEKVTEFIFKDYGPLILLNRKHKRLVGPSEKLNGVTINEILTMSQFYAAYKSGKQEMLWPFLAVIYRPIMKGKKTAFDISNVHLREKIVKSMPQAQILLTIKWFEANMKRLHDANPDLPSSGKSSGNHIELLLQLAKDGPFGDFDKVTQSPADLVYVELNRIAKENNEIKAQLKK